MGSVELRELADRVGVGYYDLDDAQLRTKLQQEAQ
jgi:hypothetical protein